MNEKSTVAFPEWLDVAMDIIRFFLQHSTLEYDGTKHTARVRYHGPSGWKVTLDTAYTPTLEATEPKVLEGK